MLAQCVTMALLVEAIWEAGKMIWQNGRIDVNQCGVICLAIGACIVTRTALLQEIGISAKIPWVDEICTGLLLSRGSNFVHDLLEKVQKAKRS